jgi:hypothetical protein
VGLPTVIGRKKGQLVLTALHNVEINERNQEMLSIFLIMEH